ncbi:asparagine--tRNA ligase [Fluviispira multicolorata]|uniref:Asparagine--tRNA ligase n=1 Tax=Fluviispira multicolorata TaxID=2654512 RepID=A0A833JFJ2_9BACT|nr:asparagine--tRNA ligase [Fluviispira multicolorata]KAB8033735.1 asparagine--tRNA ligase [Fluviispira multicolorata]
MTTLLSQLTQLSEIHADKIPPSHITIAGWVRTKRGSKKLSFIEINDGTCAKSLQVIVDASLSNYADVEKLTTGCSVKIEGNLVLSPAKGQKYEMQAKNVHVFGYADPETFPLQKKEMTFEYLREVAHVRPRTSTFSSVFRIRSRVSTAIHRFFEEQGFFYAHTPVVTTADGEGAGESFKVTNFDFDKLPKTKEGKTDFSQDFFAEPTMLCVTGQLEGELMTMGLNRVYTFGPTFRAENSNTSRHLAEFWMVEPEFAFADLNDNMQLAQDMIRFVVSDVLKHCSDDIDVCIQKTQNDTREYLKMALERPFVRVSYTEAVDILSKCKTDFENPVFWGCDLKSEHERYLCEEHFKSPTIVFDYPEELKAFYMYLNDDGKTVRAMDILMPGIGEVIGGSQREDREDILIARMKKLGIDTNAMDWYISIRRFGSVPHSGFGVGLERLIMWITGMSNIRDVIPFPRTPGNCKF